MQSRFNRSARINTCQMCKIMHIVCFTWFSKWRSRISKGAVKYQAVCVFLSLFFFFLIDWITSWPMSIEDKWTRNVTNEEFSAVKWNVRQVPSRLFLKRPFWCTSQDNMMGCYTWRISDMMPTWLIGTAVCLVVFHGRLTHVKLICFMIRLIDWITH